MIKKRYIILVLGVISVFLGSLLVNNVILAQTGGEYDPWLDYNDDGIIDVNDLHSLGQVYSSSGDSTKNVNVTNWPSSLLAEPTVTRIAGYVIGPLDTSSVQYVKVGELVVPKGEKWYVYRMSFAYDFPDPYDYRNLILRLIMGYSESDTVLDEVRAYLWGGSFKLIRPVQLLESAKIELWIRMDPSAWVLDCSLAIEAWIEEM